MLKKSAFNTGVKAGPAGPRASQDSFVTKVLPMPVRLESNFLNSSKAFPSVLLKLFESFLAETFFLDLVCLFLDLAMSKQNVFFQCQQLRLSC